MQKSLPGKLFRRESVRGANEFRNEDSGPRPAVSAGNPCGGNFDQVCADRYLDKAMNRSRYHMTGVAWPGWRLVAVDGRGMGFVHEQIATNEHIDFTTVNSGFGKVLITPSQWVIDRQRQAFIVWLEQEREPPQDKFYALSWNGKIFNVVVSDVEMEQPDGRLTRVRKIVRVYAPHDRSTGGAELMAAALMAKEALLVWAQWLESAYNCRTDEIHVESVVCSENTP